MQPSAEPGCVHFVPFDLADLEGIAGLVKKLRKDYGPIYGLVNNAGISVEGTLAMMHISQIEQVMRLNTLSPMVMTKSVVRSMMADGAGRIINIASVVAFTGYSGLAVYSASKASLVGFTRSLAREVGKLGITVNAVAPGFVDTEMTRGMKDEQREQIVRRSALKRLVEVEDVANAVEFLLSHRAKSITGTGLGLPITKALIEQHGGTLSIDSKPGAGTTVTLTLPNGRIVGHAVAEPQAVS